MAEHELWRLAGLEPGLEDMLSDPIVLALMSRDGVERAELKAVLSDAAQRLELPAPLGPMREVA